MQGTIAFFHDQNGYGFIEVEGEDDDVYFNVDEQADDFVAEEGAEVEFEREEADKGPKAVNIEVVE